MSAEREGLRERIAREIMSWDEPGWTGTPSTRHYYQTDRVLALLDSEPEPDARYVVDDGPLGDAFQAEIAAKVLLGEVPRESIDCEGLGHHMRSLARRLRILPVGPVPRVAPLGYVVVSRFKGDLSPTWFAKVHASRAEAEEDLREHVERFPDDGFTYTVEPVGRAPAADRPEWYADHRVQGAFLAGYSRGYHDGQAGNPHDPELALDECLGRAPESEEGGDHG